MNKKRQKLKEVWDTQKRKEKVIIHKNTKNRDIRRKQGIIA